MEVEKFIASRLKIKEGMAVISIAVSFFVIITALSVSSGFRTALGEGISSLSGDIQLSPAYNNYLGDDDPVSASPSYLPEILGVKGVVSAEPVIYRAGIAKKGDRIKGILFKGTDNGNAPLHADIPSGLAESLGLSEGDEFVTYFTSSKTRVRKFTVASIMADALDNGREYMVTLPIGDLRRLNGWSEDQASGLEIVLEPRYRSPEAEREKAAEIGSIASALAQDESEMLAAISSAEKFPNIFNWLDMIGFNLMIILILMILVAGFNMISGLLILLFRNISTIGTLKALGMKDRGIAGVFLRASASLAGKGLLIGNALAIALCLVQEHTHILRLDPQNYFISYVPASMDIPGIITCDLIAFAVIMLLLLIPCLFISRIDPSETSKSE